MYINVFKTLFAYIIIICAHVILHVSLYTMSIKNMVGLPTPIGYLRVPTSHCLCLRQNWVVEIVGQK